MLPTSTRPKHVDLSEIRGDEETQPVYGGGISDARAHHATILSIDRLRRIMGITAGRMRGNLTRVPRLLCLPATAREWRRPSLRKHLLGMRPRRDGQASRLSSTSNG